MEMMSRMSFMDVGLESDPPLSPELNLGTMNTSDMFDTGWDNSSGIESGTSGTASNSSPYIGFGDDNLFVWDDTEQLDANLFQANLDCFGDETDFLSLGDNEVPLEPEDFSFLQDSTSNISFASDISSSSSTITSYSIPHSPDHSIAMLEEESLVNTQPLSTSSPLKSAAEDKSQQRLPLPEPHISQVPENCTLDTANNLRMDKQRSKENSRSGHTIDERGASPKKCKKNQRNPLSPQLPQKSSGSISSVPISLSSDTSRKTKIHTKENSFSPSKKVVNILDSNVKWSELSDGEQRAVGEGLEMVLSQCIGVRERLDLMALLEPDSVPLAPMNYDDMEWTIKLDDEKLEILRHFLRNLDGSDTYSYAEEPNRKKTKVTSKKDKKIMATEWHSFAKGKQKVSLNKNRKQVWDRGSKPPLLKKHITNIQTPGSQSGKSWSSLTKGTVMKVSPSKSQQSKNTGKKCSASDLHLRTRSRKEYRQLMKERRSGLFEKEEVVTLSATASHPCSHPSQGDEEEDEEDIDILG